MKHSRGTTLIVTFVACDRSWLLLAWEPSTPSYLLDLELSSADRSVAGSSRQVLPGLHSLRFAVTLATLTIPLQRGLIQLSSCYQSLAGASIRLRYEHCRINGRATAVGAPPTALHSYWALSIIAEALRF
jgi:hypothetical protein